MAIKVAKILERMSILESKRAVFNGLVDILKSNYLPNDGGDPEHLFYRQDLGVVPPGHIEEAIQALFEMVEAIEGDLANWADFEVPEEKERKKKHGAAKDERPTDNDS